MPRGRPVDPEQRAQVAALHAAGRTRNDIARELGLGAATVSRIATELGLSFDREQVKAATEAKQADVKALRADLRLRLLTKAGELIDQMDEPHLAYSFGGKDNTYNEHELPRPPTGDLRNLMTSAAVAIDKHAVLEKLDATSGADTAASMLGRIASGLRQAWEDGDAGLAADEPQAGPEHRDE